MSEKRLVNLINEKPIYTNNFTDFSFIFLLTHDDIVSIKKIIAPLDLHKNILYHSTIKF
jgi:hypothetical protein